jgi:hypothetical protein
MDGLVLAALSLIAYYMKDKRRVNMGLTKMGNKRYESPQVEVQALKAN